MRKIFLDCGAHKATSIKKFREEYPNADDYVIISFECNPKFKQILRDVDDITFYNKAICIKDGKTEFYLGKGASSSLIYGKTRGNLNFDNPIEVETIDLSKWIMDNFTKDDYIILKLDIEGAEYEVVEDLYETKILGYINEFHGELHGPKKGKRMIDDLKLIERLKKYDLKLYTWNGSNKIKSIYHSYYDHETMIREYKKWSKRNYPTDDFMKEIKIYLSDTDKWIKENL